MIQTVVLPAPELLGLIRVQILAQAVLVIAMPALMEILVALAQLDITKILMIHAPSAQLGLIHQQALPAALLVALVSIQKKELPLA